MRLSIAALVFCASAFLVVNPTNTISGMVVGVTDGDTITVLYDANVQHKIRLDSIDAPEFNHAGVVVTGANEPKDKEKQTVYVTKTGTKYHRSGCRYLSKSQIPMSLDEAKKRFSPCSVCKPPK